MTDRPQGSISACVVCRDEADRLAACLASVSWADEIVVCDLQSSDASPQVARAHGARVVEHPAVPIVELVRNVVADAATGEWVLALDPDERVTAGLAAALRLAAERSDVDAVVLPRMNHDFGYPASSPLQRHEPQLRMYRRSAVRWPTVVHALPAVDEARVLRLPARDDLALVHDRNRNIPEAIDRVRRYAPAQARAMVEAGEVFSARRMLVTLGEKLYRHVVLSRALGDGVPGLVRAGVLVAFHFYVWAAFWQESGAARAQEDDRLLARLDAALHGMDRVARALTTPARVLRALRR